MSERPDISPWEPVNNGAGKRTWFLTRRDESIPITGRFHFSSRGSLVRYASGETAQRAADKLNRQETIATAGNGDDGESTRDKES
jgi:hypothetical protein